MSGISSDALHQARKHIEGALVKKAGEDAGFRARLLATPHAAIDELVGMDPIPSTKVTVIEEKPGEVVIVLPAALSGVELPDDLLDLASGGVSFSAFILYGPPYPDRKPKRG